MDPGGDGLIVAPAPGLWITVLRESESDMGFASLVERLQHEPAITLTVQRTRGSVPREAGTWMVVFAQGEWGTIGGGHLEFEAMAHARTLLSEAADAPPLDKHFVLGPSLGQCCGGEVVVQLARVTAQDLPRLQQLHETQRRPLALFGGGHVGKALVQVLAPLPFAVRWIDSRDEIFPSDIASQVACEHSNPVQAAVADLLPYSAVLIMSFSHAEDLDVVMACLLRQREKGDLPYVGLIGSATKWASFRSRLRSRGFSEVECDHVTCPIGVPGIAGKEPEVIAVAVAAQLLQLPS
jgi:xanthine dehydrogenase accessory factor